MSVKKKYHVKRINSYNTKEFLLNIHYAKRMPNIVICFGLFDAKSMKGVITFGMPPTPFFSKLFGHTNYLELNRLCVVEGLEKNVLSYFVSQSLKMIKKDLIIVSYADANYNHAGYIYQATNWLYTGKGRVNQQDKRGVNRFFYKEKEFHERHIPETMKRLLFKVDSKKDKNTNWIDNGGIIKKQLRKHRYFYVVGSEKFKNSSLKAIKAHFNIQEYPKDTPKRYNVNYKPKQKLLSEVSADSL